MRMRCTYYVPGSGNLSGSIALDRAETGLNSEGGAKKQFDSRRLHHSSRCSSRCRRRSQPGWLRPAASPNRVDSRRTQASGRRPSGSPNMLDSDHREFDRNWLDGSLTRASSTVKRMTVSGSSAPALLQEDAPLHSNVRCGSAVIERALVRADAVVVSNHGGRQLDGVAPTLRVLPEVIRAADGKAEVLVDGGIRRGADIAKALESCSSTDSG